MTQKHEETQHSVHGILDALAMIVIIFMLISGIESCSRAHAYRSDHGVPPCAITAAMDSLMNTVLTDNAPGAIVAVMRSDTIVYDHAFGMARLDSLERVSDSTIFNISSASKLITGVAIMKLVEQGKLNLDDSLSKFFPEFPARYFDHITVRHVLTHTSGLPDLRPTNRNEWADYLDTHVTAFGYDNDYRLYGTEKDHMQSFLNLDTIAHEPGVYYERRDISYILVAPLIERVTGQSFSSWMRANIFAPAGMTETFYYRAGLRVPRMAHGYRPADPQRPVETFRSEDGRWDEYDYNEAEYFLTKADRGVFSSARDYMKFKRALVHGELIPPALLDTILKPYISTFVPNVVFGLSTAIDTAQVVGGPKAYHLNQNGGFSVITCWWPEHDVHMLMFAARNDLDQRGLMKKMDSIIASAGWLE